MRAGRRGATAGMKTFNLKGLTMSPIELRITGDTFEDIRTQAAEVAGVTSPDGGDTGDGGTPTPDPTSIIESPDYASITVVNGKLVGPAFLKQRNGEVGFFVTDADGNPVPSAQPAYGTLGWQVSIGGRELANALTLLYSRATGFIYWKNPATWEHLKTGTTGAQPGAPPPPVGDSVDPGAPPVMPAEPVPASPAPGSTQTRIMVGPSYGLTTLTAAIAAASPGDTLALEPGAVFVESIAINKPLRIESDGVVRNPGTATATWSGGATIDCLGVSLAQGKGGIVPLADVEIVGIEIRNVGMAETSAGLTSGIRPGASCRISTAHCYIHDCQNGFGSGGYPVVWESENDLIENCGIGDHRTHNIYMSGQVVRASYKNLTSRVGAVSGRTNGGYPLKSRANVFSMSGGYLAPTDSACLDLPDGTTTLAVIDGVTFIKKAGDSDHKFLTYGEESTNNGAAGIVFTNCTSDLQCDTPLIVTNGPVTFGANCMFTGNRPAAQGSGKIVGL